MPPGKGVRQHPFESPPGRMHLHRPFQPGVVAAQVGKASADVGDDHHLPPAIPQAGKQFLHGRAAGLPGPGREKQGAGAAADGPAFFPEDHVAVPAQSGIAAPFPTGKGHQAFRFMELAGGGLDLPPEAVGDLKVVALVGTDVQEGVVAGKAEVVPDGIGSDGFLALAVEIGPISPEPLPSTDPDGIGPPRQTGSRVFHGKGVVSGLIECGKDCFSRAPHRIAPAILQLAPDRNRLANSSQGGSHGHQALRFAGHYPEPGRIGQAVEGIGGETVDQHPQLEGFLSEGLNPPAGRAAAAVSQDQLDPIPLTQEPLHDFQVKCPAPGSQVVLGVVAQLEAGPIGSPGGGVVGGVRPIELGHAAVGGIAHGHLDRAGVVNAEEAGRVGQPAGPVTAGNHPAAQTAAHMPERIGAGFHHLVSSTNDRHSPLCRYEISVPPALPCGSLEEEQPIVSMKWWRIF